jgi:hypothetical protein
MESVMDEEVNMLFALWQKIESGKAAWVEEISLRHGVPAPDDLSRVCSLRIHAKGPAADAVMAECTEVLAAVDLLHRNISDTLSYPSRGSLKYRHGADLWGRLPLVAITDSSLHFIDVALIGPVSHAAALLASDPRLLAAARTRWLYLPEDDGWAKRIREILARADSIIASRAIEGALGAT